MISVLLLTRNRAGLLARCLAALAQQQHVGVPWEVVVLDTGSTDATPALLGSLAHEPPALPYALVRAPAHPGEAFAASRARCVAFSRGDILFFIDDDCLPPPCYLAQGLRAMQQLDALGGLVLGANALPFHPWYHPHMAWTVGLSMPGSFDPAEAGRYQYPQTANLAIRRAALMATGFQATQDAFHESGGIYVNEREDSALWRRLRLAGARLGFDPSWVIWHHTPPQRAQLSTMLRRARRDGAAEARQRFNRGAALQASQSIGREVWGALACATLLLPPSGDAGARDWPAIPPLAWALREAAHLREFRRLAPPKLRRRLLPALASGFIAGVRDQARAAAARLLPASTATRSIQPSPEPDEIHVWARACFGDLVILGGVLSAIHSARPEARVVLIGPGRTVRALYADCPFVHTCLDVAETNDPARLLRTPAASQRASVMALMPYWHGSTDALRSLEARGYTPAWVAFDRDMGFLRRRDADFPHHRVPKDLRLPECLNLARLFQWAGLERPPEVCGFPWITDHPEVVAALPNPPFIAIQPWSAMPDKTWCEGRWGEVMRRCLQAHPRHHIVVLASPAEHLELQRMLHRQGLSHHARVHDGAAIEAPDPIRGLFTILRRASILLTTCSGPRHVAHAVGCPTVVLQGTSDEHRWSPWPALPATHLCTLRARPWGLTDSERAGGRTNEEMLAISVEMVVDACTSMIAGSTS